LPLDVKTKERVMGFISKVQVIQRGEINRQFYFICPAPLAQALEIEKGENIEWVVVDKMTLMIRRVGQQEVSSEKTDKKVKGKKASRA
jgi:bifunctional DNA-binding transcriptional regulator/antitoxin component of YhaV-PrlF toxin-antitoxin module